MEKHSGKKEFSIMILDENFRRRTMNELEIHKALIKEQLTELLDTYYNGSFPQMACEYIHAMGMTKEEVEELLEANRTIKHLIL